MALTLPAFLQPVLALLGLGLGIGALLGHVARTFRLETDPVVEQINDLLPQTQCGQCGYPGCKPYAAAIARGDAINKCPPGGDRTIRQLADLLNVSVIPLDENHGKSVPRKVAFIREEECIGCAKCIPACPVDAIIGAPKFMHTVIESECTGCDLCIEPCPVDCIDMIPVTGQEDIPDLMRVTAHFNACINCGLCIDECPVSIMPHELYHACRTEDLERAERLKLMHCIECTKCDAVCPAGIPLTETYQLAKQQRRANAEESFRAERAKWRFEAHRQRALQRQAEEDERRKRRAELASRGQASAASIKAALERVKAKRDNL